jgi:PPM family protein phosphatase
MQQQIMQLDVAVLSECGGRSENQDACGHWAGQGAAYFVVCDGAGGHLGGAVASRVAVAEALGALRASSSCSADALENAMRAANDGLVREQKSQTQFSQMRATIVALAIDLEQGTATWGHIGDSRLYGFRENRIVVQTRDHSVVQSLVDAGYLQPRELRTSPDRSKLLSALGDAEQFEPALERDMFTVAPGDRFLLCTDGVWEYIEESELEQSLSEAASAEAWLKTLQSLVVARGKRRHDNYSAVAVWCE